jgi:D-alanyl-D-alanine carboxypeptidase
MKRTFAAGNAIAKTGSIANVRTLSGYVRDRNGRLIAFSFLYNGRGTSAARGVQTELGELLANYPNAPVAAKKTDDGSTKKPAARSRTKRSR